MIEPMFLRLGLRSRILLFVLSSSVIIPHQIPLSTLADLAKTLGTPAKTIVVMIGVVIETYTYGIPTKYINFSVFFNTLKVYFSPWVKSQGANFTMGNFTQGEIFLEFPPPG